MLLYVHCKCVLRDVYGDDGDGKEGKHLYDPEESANPFTAGADDPVGNFGKGVRKVYEIYQAAGIQDVSLRLYAGDRHELLNETDREQVFSDLLEWMEERR